MSNSIIRPNDKDQRNFFGLDTKPAQHNKNTILKKYDKLT